MKAEDLNERIETQHNVVMKRSKKGQKAKYVSIYSEEAKDKQCILLPGRHPCLCEASIHKLIANCLNCGRIVCTQEQAGPCFTCGKMVPSTDAKSETVEDLENSKSSFLSLTKSVKNENCGGLKDIAASFEKAVALKNKLLDYDKESKSTTTVIDDESDYFRLSSEHWLTDAQRKEVEERIDEIHEKKHSKSHKLVIDLAGKQITAVNEPEVKDVEAAVKAIEQKTSLQSDYEIDSNLMELSDEGICLSIQQPWASLLMHSIKLHEGRNWYTPYRGRVWIHAAAKEPRQEDITKAENLFRLIGDFTEFPKSYPCGVLLGYAYLVDCLHQEDYSQQFPDGYNDTLYTFIFEDPARLNVNIPMKGKAKLFKLSEQMSKFNVIELVGVGVLTIFGYINAL
ncbi:activating signal cointegrator 1-like isoform X1 [Dinothrombium tinctorium]|uniref:Activating signal cointegrator 1-like isoform X1 n=1 Tax=Dinothrombium tinctorium TaxID=1965070 RepID=A0A3S3P5Z2_9ACAR|nr:activating signal cointegrator 1-like isoform X1 [Dinothrombium tinctorium]